MPNWCMNELFVSGRRRQLEEFRSQVCAEGPKGEPLDFERIDPTPPEAFDRPPTSETSVSRWRAMPLEELDAETWRVVRWGTKWPPEDIEVVVADNASSVSYRFDTASSPPFQIVERLAARYPSLGFRLAYYDLDNEIAGQVTFRGRHRVSQATAAGNGQFMRRALVGSILRDWLGDALRDRP